LSSAFGMNLEESFPEALGIPNPKASYDPERLRMTEKRRKPTLGGFCTNIFIVVTVIR